MIIKTLTSVKHQNYNKSALQLITGVVFCLMFFQVNAAGVTTGAEPASGNLNGSSKKDSDFSKGGSISTEPGFLNNQGPIRGTDFSRETATSREIEDTKPAGFSNKIIFTTSVAHDSNPALDSRKKSVWIYSLAPRLLLDYIGELNSFYLDAALLIQRHSNEEILTNREDPTLRLGWDRTYESGAYGLYAGYNESSTRGEELRTAGVLSSIANVDNTQTQRVRQYGAKWEHKIAPRWSLFTNGEYSEQVFSGGVGLIDFTSIDVMSKLNYEYTERLDTYLQVGFAQTRPDQTFNDTDLTRLALGADYQLSEAIRVSSRAGTYHLSGRQSDTDWEAGIQARYDVGRMGYVAELNRELGAAAIGGFQKSDTFRLGWFYDISEFDKLNVDYTLVKFKQDAQVGLLKSEAQQISAYYDRILRGNWRGQANITFRENKTDSRNDGNIVGVSLIYDGLSF